MNSTTYAEQALLDLLPTLSAPAAGQLVAGNRTGALPAALLSRFPSAPLAVHAFDCYHARAISDFLEQAGFESAGVVRCTPSVSAELPYSRAFFQTTPRSMSAELVLDQLEDIHQSLSDGSSLFAAFEGDADSALATAKKVFSSVRVVKRDKKAVLLRCTRTGPLAKPRCFAADWTASVPGGEPLVFTSFPGCFCHRRADPGGLALAEIAAKTVEASRSALCLSPSSPMRILDMGCGCGLVGLLVADAWRRLGGRVSLTLVDSHARAIAAARVNAERFGFSEQTRFVLSDDGLPRGEVATHDLFVGNPPYYSEYRIAEIFLSTAYRALRPGGLCLTVVKTATGLKSLQEKYFRTSETVPRRGYAVLRSIR